MYVYFLQTVITFSKNSFCGGKYKKMHIQKKKKIWFLNLHLTRGWESSIALRRVVPDLNEKTHFFPVKIIILYLGCPPMKIKLCSRLWYSLWGLAWDIAEMPEVHYKHFRRWVEDFFYFCKICWCCDHCLNKFCFYFSAKLFSQPKWLCKQEKEPI